MRLPVTDPSLSPLHVGDFEMAVLASGLSTVRWRGVEVLRGVTCLLRDENGATFSPENGAMTMSADTGFSQRTFRQTVELGGLAAVNLTVRVDPAGRLGLAVEITAKRNFLTNRAGLVVLHPIRGGAGTKATDFHPDQSDAETAFPKLISPSQPVSSIAVLPHHTNGVAVRIAYSDVLHDAKGRHAIPCAPVVPDWGIAPWQAVQDSVFRFQSHLAEVLQGRAPPQPSGADNLHTLALSWAAYDVAAQQRTIDMKTWKALAA